MMLEDVTVSTIYHNWYEYNQNSEGFFPYLGLPWLMWHHKHFKEIIQKCVNIKTIWLLCSLISTSK